jgi:hypothetical protein
MHTKQKPDAQTQQKGGKGTGQGKEKETAGNTRNTRHTDTERSCLSRGEIEVLPGQEIMNATEGMRYLESTLLTIPDIVFNVKVIMGALFQISMLPSIKANHKYQ